jgi:hypothetical protein
MCVPKKSIQQLLARPVPIVTELLHRAEPLDLIHILLTFWEMAPQSNRLVIRHRQVATALSRTLSNARRRVISAIRHRQVEMR